MEENNSKEVVGKRLAEKPSTRRQSNSGTTNRFIDPRDEAESLRRYEGYRRRVEKRKRKERIRRRIALGVTGVLLLVIVIGVVWRLRSNIIAPIVPTEMEQVSATSPDPIVITEPALIVVADRELTKKWTIDNTTSYQFNADGTGLMILPSQEYAFAYTAQDEMIEIDFVDESARDKKYTYSIDGDTLTLTDTSTYGGTYTMTIAE